MRENPIGNSQECTSILAAIQFCICVFGLETYLPMKD